MSKRIKMKDIIKEGFSTLGGVVSRNAFGKMDMGYSSLTKIVKEKYGEVEEEAIDVKGLTTELTNFESIGEHIFGKSNINTVAEKLSWIANQAKSHTLSETEDWFDKVTVSRNMKELTGLSSQFGKIANEAKSLQQRMGALYEDMGNILGRYYELGEVTQESSKVETAGDKDEYQKFFRMALKKFGVTEPDELDDDKKKDFYNYVDANWKGDNESD
jgi:hypothetical protein